MESNYERDELGDEIGDDCENCHLVGVNGRHAVGCPIGHEEDLRAQAAADCAVCVVPVDEYLEAAYEDRTEVEN